MWPGTFQGGSEGQGFYGASPPIPAFLSGAKRSCFPLPPRIVGVAQTGEAFLATRKRASSYKVEWGKEALGNFLPLSRAVLPNGARR
jgi:hypothetical protein